VSIDRVVPRLPVPARVSFTRFRSDYHITLRVPAVPARWTINGRLDVMSDDPLQPVFEIPVVGLVQRPHPFDVAAAERTDKGLYSLAQGAMFMDENKLTPPKFIQQVLGGIRDQRSVDLMRKGLEDENWYIRQRAINVLQELRATVALASIRTALYADEQAETRRAALHAIMAIDRPGALPDLVLGLQDDDSYVRSDAAILLGDLGDKRAIGVLQQMEDDTDPEVRDAAKESLKQLGAD
jgi:hypothetical protein